MLRRLGVLCAALAVTLAGAGAVRAHEDPASDLLIGQKVFFNPEEIPKAQQQELTATVRSANANGYPIRVALIRSDDDLGADTALWRQPQHYATFLSFELTSYYKGRLLTVMPNGFGFAWPKHATAKERAALAKIPIGNTAAALARAGVEAVQALAAGDGVKLSSSGDSAGESNANRDRLKIVFGVLVLVVLGAGARLLSRRRASG